MSDGLDVIIIDDDKGICEIIKELVENFYSWGDVISFSNAEEAIDYCLQRDVGVAIFIIDVFLGGCY
jgi:response regulator of citrate/malate metabolism